MPTDYPLDLLSEDGSTLRLQVLADFTDPDNQPAPFPIQTPATGDTVFIKDSDGDATFDFDADAGPAQFNFGYGIHVHGAIKSTGQIDGGGLGPTIAYVTVQAAAPTTYLTPIVVDTTAVTGATYAWDGSAYQKIADLLT